MIYTNFSTTRYIVYIYCKYLQHYSVCRTMQARNESVVNFPVAFDETMYPSSMKYWFFFIYYRHGSSDIMVSAWLDERPNTVGRCITVWNLSAVAVVTGPTSRYLCITCLHVVVSGILSVRLWTRACIYTCVFSRNIHARVAARFRNAMDYRDIRVKHERSRAVETAYICECLSMQPLSELFIFKTIFK